jgi:hypothetical protein
MTSPSSLEPEAERPEGPLEHNPGASLFAHTEGLMGEEQALLLIPAQERKAHEHERLRAIGEELDRVYERLHERAKGHRVAPAAG